MEKVIQQLKDDRQRVLEENNRLQAVNAQLQLDNASLQQENTELKTRLGLSTTEIQIEFPPSPSSLAPSSPASLHSPSPPSSPTAAQPSPSPVSPATPVTSLLESAVLSPLPQEQGSRAPGLSSKDLTPWVVQGLVTLWWALLVSVTVASQSSQSACLALARKRGLLPPRSTSQPSTAPPRPSPLPLKKRSKDWVSWTDSGPP